MQRASVITVLCHLSHRGPTGEVGRVCAGRVRGAVAAPPPPVITAIAPLTLTLSPVGEGNRRVPNSDVTSNGRRGALGLSLRGAGVGGGGGRGAGCGRRRRGPGGPGRPGRGPRASPLAGGAAGSTQGPRGRRARRGRRGGGRRGGCLRGGRRGALSPGAGSAAGVSEGGAGALGSGGISAADSFAKSEIVLGDGGAGVAGCWVKPSRGVERQRNQPPATTAASAATPNTAAMKIMALFRTRRPSGGTLHGPPGGAPPSRAANGCGRDPGQRRP